VLGLAACHVSSGPASLDADLGPGDANGICIADSGTWACSPAQPQDSPIGSVGEQPACPLDASPDVFLAECTADTDACVAIAWSLGSCDGTESTCVGCGNGAAGVLSGLAYGCSCTATDASADAMVWSDCFNLINGSGLLTQVGYYVCRSGD